MGKPTLNDSAVVSLFIGDSTSLPVLDRTRYKETPPLPVLGGRDIQDRKYIHL